MVKKMWLLDSWGGVNTSQSFSYHILSQTDFISAQLAWVVEYTDYIFAKW